MDLLKRFWIKVSLQSFLATSIWFNSGFDVTSLEMLLGSAMYFESKWQQEMKLIGKLPFTNANRKYQMEYIHVSKKLGYEKIKLFENVEAEIVEIPYKVMYPN